MAAGVVRRVLSKAAARAKALLGREIPARVLAKTRFRTALCQALMLRAQAPLARHLAGWANPLARVPTRLRAELLVKTKASREAPDMAVLVPMLLPVGPLAHRKALRQALARKTR